MNKKLCAGGVVAKLRESAGDSSGRGRYRVRIISPGQGSSGVYTRENLAASASLFKAGTPMFMDHPTRTEDFDRPERSVKDLAGRLVTDAAVGEDGALYAECEVYPSVNAVIRERWADIGVSINAWTDQPKEADGVIPPLTGVHSVDFVTVAGAGGGLTDVLECARKENTVTREEMLSTIREALKAFDDEKKKKAEEEKAKADAAKAEDSKNAPEKTPEDAEKEKEDEKKKRKNHFEAARSVLRSGLPEDKLEDVFMEAVDSGRVEAAIDAARVALNVREAAAVSSAPTTASDDADMDLGFITRY